MNRTDLISIERIEKSIYFIRGEKVMLDRDLAELYEVQTKALNETVRRNAERFPSDFMFQLSGTEVAELNRSQFVTGPQPYAFTEEGVLMLSSVLRSKRAITVNIEMIRVFVKSRQLVTSNVELARRLDELESKYDKQIKIVFDAIRKLTATSAQDRKEIGFVRDRDG